MALDPDRRRQLHGLKLRALVEEHLSSRLRDVTGTDDGAIGVAADDRGRELVVALAEERPVRGLGGALAAAQRADVSEIHVFATDDAGVLARRAELFEAPVHVWALNGRAAERANAASSALAAEAPSVPELAALMELADVEVVVEHGVVLGEVQGLEVARVVTDDLGPRLEVGVGAHDREAFALLNGDMPTPDAIRKVAEVVRTHRAAGADPHPLNRLGAERWLRAKLIERPELVGAAQLRPAEPPVPRTNLKEPVPAVAMGAVRGGAPIVVVTSVGIDLDLVPFAADARHHLEPSAELVLATPARDAHEIILAMADSLKRPARVKAIDDDWREWSDAASVA